jgi:hypothetical protein
MKLSKGDKVWFAEEKQGYTVRACNDRYAVCTKPFNPKRTVLYSIVDLKEDIRGRENLIFCMGFETDQLCNEALQRLISGESEVSHRHHIELKIIKVQQSKNK